MSLSKTQQGLITRAGIMAAKHHRILSMPMDAIVVWHRLVIAIIEFGTDGILTLDDAGGCSLPALARFRLFVSETQLETYIGTWLGNLAITYDAQSGVIALPAELMPSRRAIASRLNGKKGGRLPKNANPAPKDDPRQRTAMMPIAGGKAVSVETQNETQETHARDKLSLASSNSFKEKAKLATTVDKAVVDAAFQRIGPKAFEAAGFDPARDMGSYGIVRQWCADALQSGLSVDETDRLICGVVASVADRQRAKGSAAKHLGYFGRAVADAIERGDVPEVPLSAAEEAANAAWLRDMQTWRDDVTAPMPDRNAYLARAREAA